MVCRRVRIWAGPLAARTTIPRETRPFHRKETSHGTFVKRLISSRREAACGARRKTPHRTGAPSQFGATRSPADDGHDPHWSHARGDESGEHCRLVAGLDVHRRLPGFPWMDHPRRQYRHRADDLGHRCDEPRPGGRRRERDGAVYVHERGGPDDPPAGRHADVPGTQWRVSRRHLPGRVGGHRPGDVRDGRPGRRERPHACRDELRRSHRHSRRRRHLPADRGDERL